jgi:hypothetical protein
MPHLEDRGDPLSDIARSYNVPVRFPGFGTVDMPTFPDALKNVVPSLEKATEVTFVLLLTSFFLLADCAALFVHGMNLLHLADMPNVTSAGRRRSRSSYR